ncbi:hypothetical protein A8924_0504 [Saccharopolyspora erythraea NRRL 2338]|uniref:Uncharacterized protein n=2 Tax=Saccharopolyspora erythraea TaxID=1836 RepID=A4F5Z7_SACEN|nr:hypothetical protein [Saccharopolyspora erythraea]PFG93270.1 hypothetical protein A8924_0504 [Saccharopolyspora erythraea NRRL 2338]QRK90121.1 hypothetical protein JQX30_00585 [Saccharopolyspora erythraea]CAL99471.1 hypothetical protein SACE_0118 [Saccharopolyspora erythraea NRRL 2338]
MSRDHGFEIRARGESTRPPRRRRVVLADSKRRTRQVARTMMELEEQTSVGEFLVRHLMKVQMRSALLLAGFALLVLLSLPALFYALPSLGDTVWFGMHVSWLVLGVLPYPFLVLVGYLCVRVAERHERDFIHMVEQ